MARRVNLVRAIRSNLRRMCAWAPGHVLFRDEIGDAQRGARPADVSRLCRMV